MPVTEHPPSLVPGFTERQVEVMDLLAAHMTSKQIGLALGISPKTVDRHVDRVRLALSADDRVTAARVWMQMRGLEGVESGGAAWVNSPPPLSPLATSGAYQPSGLRDLPGSPLFTVHDAASIGAWNFPRERRPVLEALDDRFGKIGRVVAVVVLVSLLSVTIILSLAIAHGLDHLM